MARPPGRFVQGVYGIDPEILDWLVFFVARRVLACWEINTDEPRPRQVVNALGRYRVRGEAIDWPRMLHPTPSPFDDCRYTDTQTASNAIGAAARFMYRREPVQAVYCIASASVAYQHVLIEDRYRDWLVEVAIPVAYARREMTVEEIEALRAAVYAPVAPIAPDDTTHATHG